MARSWLGDRGTQAMPRNGRSAGGSCGGRWHGAAAGARAHGDPEQHQPRECGAVAGAGGELAVPLRCAPERSSSLGPPGLRAVPAVAMGWGPSAGRCLCPTSALRAPRHCFGLHP